jgi:hypothetical protein
MDQSGNETTDNSHVNETGNTEEIKKEQTSKNQPNGEESRENESSVLTKKLGIMEIFPYLKV